MCNLSAYSCEGDLVKVRRQHKGVIQICTAAPRPYNQKTLQWLCAAANTCFWWDQPFTWKTNLEHLCKRPSSIRMHVAAESRNAELRSYKGSNSNISISCTYVHLPALTPQAFSSRLGATWYHKTTTSTFSSDISILKTNSKSLIWLTPQGRSRGSVGKYSPESTSTCSHSQAYWV